METIEIMDTFLCVLCLGFKSQTQPGLFKNTIGDLNDKHFLGLVFKWCSTYATSSCVKSRKFVLFGIYWRIKPLFFLWSLFFGRHQAEKIHFIPKFLLIVGLCCLIASAISVCLSPALINE